MFSFNANKAAVKINAELEELWKIAEIKEHEISDIDIEKHLGELTKAHQRAMKLVMQNPSNDACRACAALLQSKKKFFEEKISRARQSNIM